MTFFPDNSKNVRFGSFYSVKMSSENGLVSDETQNKFQCKSQILSYLNVILQFKPFFAEKLQKRGKSHIFGFISEKSQLTDLNHPVFVLVLVSYNFCMIPLVCALNFGYSNPVDRGVHPWWVYRSLQGVRMWQLSTVFHIYLFQSRARKCLIG